MKMARRLDDGLLTFTIFKDIVDQYVKVFLSPTQQN